MTVQPLLPGEEGRLLGGVKIAGLKARKAQDDLERQIVRAHARGISMRNLATAAGYGSHRKVQELLARQARPAQGDTAGSTST